MKTTHPVNISSAHPGRAVRAALGILALAGAAACAGCGGGRRAAAAGPAPERSPVRTLPLAGVFVLEDAGAEPADTTVVFTTGETRVILLQHAPPDHAAFAELRLPAGAFAADSGQPVRVRLQADPGIYGLRIETSLPLRVGAAGATLTFKYPVHFLAPAGAAARYAGDRAFEHALAIGRLGEDSTVTLLASGRPSPDNLLAPFIAPGHYVVAAPR